MSNFEVLKVIRRLFAMDSSIHEAWHTSNEKSLIQLTYYYKSHGAAYANSILTLFHFIVCSPCILLIHKLCIFEKTWEVEVVKSFQSLNLLTFRREALEEGAVLTIQCITLSNRWSLRKTCSLPHRLDLPLGRYLPKNPFLSKALFIDLFLLCTCLQLFKVK